jgi:hypothetical protein
MELNFLVNLEKKNEECEKGNTTKKVKVKKVQSVR